MSEREIEGLATVRRVAGLFEQALTDANRKAFFEDIARDLFHIEGEVGA